MLFGICDKFGKIEYKRSRDSVYMLTTIYIGLEKVALTKLLALATTCHSQAMRVAGRMHNAAFTKAWSSLSTFYPKYNNAHKIRKNERIEYIKFDTELNQ